MGLTCFKSWKYNGTGQKGNRDVLASPGSYFFLSNSCGQGEEWLQSINKAVWIPFTGVFGQRLEETVLYERRYGVRLVPLVVEQCVDFIRERGLQEVGLFRRPGQATLMKELQVAFDAGERPSFDSGTDVHTVASLLKLYLRQLPEPLVPYSQYQDFMLCGKKLASDRTQNLLELRNLLHNLPVVNFNLLSYICQFLNDVQSYSSSNMMSCQNLATVFGPNILRGKAEDPHSMIGGATVIQLLMFELIREQQSLFSNEAGSRPVQTPGRPQASPAVPRRPLLHAPPCCRQLSLPLIAEHWGQGTGCPSPPPGGQSKTSSEQYDQGCSGGQTFSGAADLSQSAGQKRHPGHRYTSSHPDSHFFPLPSANHSLPQDHHNEDGPKTTERDNVESSLASEPPNFPANALSTPLQPQGPDSSIAGAGLGEEGVYLCSRSGREGEAVEGLTSGGSSEDQDSTLSVYDNLDRAPLPQSMEGDVTGSHFKATTEGGHTETSLVVGEVGQEEVGKTLDSSSSWSSCEILPLDEGCCQDNGITERGTSPFLSAKSSLRFSPNQKLEDNRCDQDEEDEIDDDEDHDNDGMDGDFYPPNSPASCSAPSDAPLSTGSSEVFLPPGAPDRQAARPQAQLEARQLHSVLAELKQQMASQRAEYQTTITRLEHCNEILQEQVVVLQASVEQHKRWHSMAEIKIRNVERARADADRRNSKLQRDMEHFFKMFGEIQGGGARRIRERNLQSF